MKLTKLLFITTEFRGLIGNIDNDVENSMIGFLYFKSLKFQAEEL